MLTIISGEQYEWLEKDLAKVDRSVTPWLIGRWHAPWYTTYKAHYRVVACNHTHQENVITSMENVMKFVIDESEDVQQDMPSCLLQDLASYLLKNVKKEEKETPPASFELAEKVIGMCHEKLKPMFILLLQDTPLDEYSKVVTSLFQDALYSGVADNSDAPGKDTVADRKSSYKTVSDESPQESSKLE